MKLSKKTKVEIFDRIKREGEAWRELAQLLLHSEEPDYVERITHNDRPDMMDRHECFEFRLYHTMRSHGGLLAVVHTHDGKIDSDVYYLDDWISKVNEMPYDIGVSSEYKIVADRLQKYRHTAYLQSNV